MSPNFNKYVGVRRRPVLQDVGEWTCAQHANGRLYRGQLRGSVLWKFMVYSDIRYLQPISNLRVNDRSACVSKVNRHST